MSKDLGPTSEGETRIIVVFVFYDRNNNSVLLERRKKPGDFFDNKIIYPGGSVEKSELENFENAFGREVKEELEVIPLIYSRIPGTENLYGESGMLIIPFLVSSWSGPVPIKVQDTESELIWLNLEAFVPELDSVRRITEHVKAYVAQS